MTLGNINVEACEMTKIIYFKKTLILALEVIMNATIFLPILDHCGVPPPQILKHFIASRYKTHHSEKNCAFE